MVRRFSWPVDEHFPRKPSAREAMLVRRGKRGIPQEELRKRVERVRRRFIPIAQKMQASKGTKASIDHFMKMSYRLPMMLATHYALDAAGLDSKITKEAEIRTQIKKFAKRQADIVVEFRDSDNPTNAEFAVNLLAIRELLDRSTQLIREEKGDIAADRFANYWVRHNRRFRRAFERIYD